MCVCVCVLRDGIRATAEPSSTALTESQSWLEARQLDDGHRLERQRRCGKNIHNYAPLNAVIAWIIDASSASPTTHAPSRSGPHFAITSLFHSSGRGASSKKLNRSRNWHKVPPYVGQLIRRAYSPHEFFYFRASTHRETDSPTAIPEQSSSHHFLQRALSPVYLMHFLGVI